jgi:hypothetical protein
MSNDPFTLDISGSPALSSGLGLGVTAFGGLDPVATNDDDPDPTPPAPAPVCAGRKPTQNPARKQGERANFYLDDQDRGLAASWKERARINIAALLDDRSQHSDGGASKCTRWRPKAPDTICIGSL